MSSMFQKLFHIKDNKLRLFLINFKQEQSTTKKRMSGCQL